MTKEVGLTKVETPVTQVFKQSLMLAFVASIPALFASCALTAYGNGDTLVAVWGVLMFALSIWSLGTTLLAIPLGMYLSLQYSKGNYAAIDAAYSRSIRLVNKLPLRRSWAMSTMLSNLALMRLCQGYYDSAESLFAEAVDYVRKDKRLRKHYYAAILLNNLAVARLRQDKPIEAELLATEAMEIMDLKKNRSPKLNIVRALINGAHGIARLEHGELDEAESYLRKACQLHETEEARSGMGATTKTQAHVMCYFGLALVLARQNRLDDSERACDRAYALLAASNGSCTLNLMALRGLNLLANEYMKNEKYERAEKLLEDAYLVGGRYSFHKDAQDTLSYFEKLFLLTQRHDEIADMRKWLRPIASISGPV